jgi:amino acid transporter
LKGQIFKRALLGRTMANAELEHTLLPKVLALPVFSSDPLSSNAYATQEILLVLGAAGTAALSTVLPIAFAVAVLLATVVVSYRQTVRAYPNGGGAYIVAHENLGTYPGLLAAAALLIDYVLTVSVSIVAGVDAILSAAPSLAGVKVALAVAFVALVTVANLRGARESGTVFAVPTYGFVLSIYILLGTGFVKCVGGCPLAESAGETLAVHQPLTIFLILKAFSAGTTALTGVEAISNGVPAFRYPQSKNAATTLTLMGVMAISMFLGISWLADHTGVVYTEESTRTVVAQIAHAVFGGGFMFYVLQAMTAGILILAANTAYQDFPRLVSILAKDRFMPRQFMNRGDRLVFSNGVLILAALASILIVIFNADLNRLIQLYLVGVFVSFTLSQSGMVVHWKKLKEPGRTHRMFINGFGAVVTGLVFVVVVTTKFLTGAWIVVAAVPVLILMMRSIGVHYARVAEELDHPRRRPVERRIGNQHMVILVTRVDAAAARAVGYVRAVSISPESVSAVTIDKSNAAAWRRLAPEIDLTVLPAPESLAKAVRKHLVRMRHTLSDDDFLTLVVPEILQRRGVIEILRRPLIHRLKVSLLPVLGVQVLNIPLLQDEIDADTDEAHEPGRNYAIVLVSGVNNASMQAIEYAETLRPSDLRAVNFGLDPEASESVGDRWLAERIPVPLEMHESPYRDMGSSLTEYVRDLRPDGVNRVVTVVIPEIVVDKVRHQFLHGQTALIVKRHLLFEPGVVVASVPYHIGEGAPRSEQTPLP